MGEKIVFPDELQRNIRLAKKAMEQKEFLTSVTYLQKAYGMEMSFEINQLYTEALLKSEDFKSALQIAQDFAVEYQKTATTITTYVRILLLNQQFLTARKLVIQNSLLTKEQKKTLTQQIKQLELAIDLLDPESLQVKRQLLNQWDESLMPIITADWEVFVGQLTYPQFIGLMQDFLPKCRNNFLRPRLVEELVLLGCDKVIRCARWDNTIATINLKELKLPEEVPAYQKLKTYFETEIAATDIQLANYCLTELSAQLAVTYPFVPFTDDLKRWEQSYILEYQAMMGNNKAVAGLEKLADITKQKEKIRQIYQVIF